MSFKTFIYYCALLGGWGAFFTWAVYQPNRDIKSLEMRAALCGALLGMFVAAAIGMLDAILNAVGFERILRVGLCGFLGLLGGGIGGLVGQVLNRGGMPLF